MPSVPRRSALSSVGRSPSAGVARPAGDGSSGWRQIEGERSQSKTHEETLFGLRCVLGLVMTARLKAAMLAAMIWPARPLLPPMRASA
jgi:hypothetical protein